MIRRSLLAVSALALLGGCTTFSNSGTAARLGDGELSLSQLEADLAEAGSPPAEGHLDAAAARTQIDSWLAGQLAEASGVLDEFAAGAESLGVACIAVMAVPEHDTAEAVVARLESGEAWDDVIADVDPAAQDGGRFGCAAHSDFNPAVLDLVAGLATDGTPTIWDDPAGSGEAIVLRSMAATEVDPQELFRSVLQANPDRADDLVSALRDDAWVNPRFGALDPTTLLVRALG